MVPSVKSPFAIAETEENESFQIVLADNQPLTAAGIESAVAQMTGARIVGVAHTKEQFLDYVQRYKPFVLIADYALDHFITQDDLKTLRDISPGTRVLIISSDDDKKRIMDVLQQDVDGYLTKNCTLEEITIALETIRSGGKYYAQKILALIVDHSIHPEKLKSNPLTVREQQLLLLLAKGHSTQSAAEELHVSPHTIHSHRKKIIRKLGIQSPTQYVVHAIEMGILEIHPLQELSKKRQNR